MLALLDEIGRVRQTLSRRRWAAAALANAHSLAHELERAIACFFAHLDLEAPALGLSFCERAAIRTAAERTQR